jgi:hypothetical protein
MKKGQKADGDKDNFEKLEHSVPGKSDSFKQT